MLNSKFANVKFELVDLSVNVAPEMYVSSANVLFTRRVLQDLGNPQYVQFCIDPTNCVFAIRPCRQNENKAADFLKGRKLKESDSLKIGNKNLHDTLAQMIPGYIPSKRYKFIGEYDPENHIMYYDMAGGTIAMYRKSVDNSEGTTELADIAE